MQSPHASKRRLCEFSFNNAHIFLSGGIIKELLARIRTLMECDNAMRYGVSLFSLVTALIVLSACSLPDPSNLPIPGRQAATAAPVATVKLAPTSTTKRPTLTPQSPAEALPTVEPVATISSNLTNALEEEQQLLTELYRRVNPAVVSIEVAANPRTSTNATPEALPYAQGSGFLVDDQGHIVTNNHVVEDGVGFQVRFADGSISEAKLVGRDPGADLAVLKVSELPNEAQPLSLADSQSVEVGQTAIAIGNPFGLRNTLTVGVISGLGRSLSGPTSGDGGRFRIPNVIQTDAAVNPGNSGGPLLNIRGEVIGVNTAIRSLSGTFEGISYAVPSAAVSRIIPALISAGHYDHPWIGVSMRDIDPLLSKHFSLPVRQGVLVTEVLRGSPADKASLRGGTDTGEYAGLNVPYNGDIIIAINGKSVRDSDELVSFLELETSVGDTVTVSVLRDGKQEEVQVVLEARPAE